MRRLFRLRARRLVFILAAVAAPMLAVTALSAGPAAASVSSTNQLVPYYHYPFPTDPNNSSLHYWDNACSALNDAGNGSWIIVTSGDARSGDGATTGGPTANYNYNYAQGIENCHHWGQNVVGYVDSAYGARPIADVEADIARWQTQYRTNHTSVTDMGNDGIDTNIDGIFLDEVPTNPSASASGWAGHTVQQYYHAIFAYEGSNAASGYNELIANTGTPTSTDWLLNDTGSPSTQGADGQVLFEGPQTSSTGVGLNTFSMPSWASNYPQGDKFALVHSNTDTSTAFASTCTTLKNAGFGETFVTNQGNGDAGNNWVSLPGSNEINWNRTYCG